MVDVMDQIGAVQRELRTVERDGRPARVVVAQQTYPTDAADLWDALTSAERIPRWFLPVSGDLREGGTYQLEGNAGGSIVRCDAPRALELTWEFGGQVSWLTVTLTADGEDRTTLDLEHTAHVPDELWQEYGPGAVGVGWDGALLGLALHVSSGGATAMSPEEVLAWSTSPEGLAFSVACAGAWTEAAIAAGEDAEQMRAAQERTVAFYTTPPAESDGQPDPA